MIANTKTDLIQRFLIVSGFIALVLSIIMGIQFYSSLGHDTVGKVTYIAVGIFLTCLVVFSPAVAVYMFQQRHEIMGTCLALLWLLLIGLEMFAEFGFLATEQGRVASDVAKDSTQARLAEEAVKTAGARVDNLVQYAGVDINAVQGELASLQAELDGAQARLSGCPANYKTKCINPARSDIARIAKQMEPLEAQVNGYNAYQAAIASKASAGKELGAALQGKDIGLAISPAYEGFSRLFGISAENVQAGTSFLIAFMLSVWASLSGFILQISKEHVSGNGNGGDYRVVVQPPAPAPQLTQADVDRIVNERIATLQLTAPKEVAESPK